MRGRAAFTLIELMVVIALIGILSAVMMPAMRGTYDDALLRSTARKLVNACSLAYSRAVSLNQVQRIRLDPQNDRFILEMHTNAVSSGAEFVPARELNGSEGTLDSRVSVVFRASPGGPSPSSGVPEEEVETEPPAPDAAQAIQFYPDGTADRKVIVLRDRDGFGLVLRINPITARVHISELPRE
jgi:prepilin-type N-terminal cleavage/methylation domain-containing protein